MDKLLGRQSTITGKIKTMTSCFILLSSFVWFTALTSNGRERVLQEYGENAATHYSNLFQFVPDVVILVMFAYILNEIGFYKIIKLSIIVSYINLSLFLFDPSNYFKWAKIDIKNGS